MVYVYFRYNVLTAFYKPLKKISSKFYKGEYFFNVYYLIFKVESKVKVTLKNLP